MGPRLESNLKEQFTLFDKAPSSESENKLDSGLRERLQSSWVLVSGHESGWGRVGVFFGRDRVT